MAALLDFSHPAPIGDQTIGTSRRNLPCRQPNDMLPVGVVSDPCCDCNIVSRQPGWHLPRWLNICVVQGYKSKEKPYRSRTSLHCLSSSRRTFNLRRSTYRQPLVWQRRPGRSVTEDSPLQSTSDAKLNTTRRIILRLGSEAHLDFGSEELWEAIGFR